MVNSFEMQNTAFKKHLQKTTWDTIPHAPISGLTPYKVIAPDGAEKGLFTGYFEPELYGSFTQNEKYSHPVYAPPADLAALPNTAESGQVGLLAWGRVPSPLRLFAPHFTRAEISSGALANQNLELLYVDDAVDLFFAHVQGSAKIIMDDGSIQRIGFAGKGGHPYTAIGKVLRERGALPLPITMQSIKTWLRENPLQQEAILNCNASYIFFKLLNGDAPVGASGQILTPEASLAVDDTIWPYGLSAIVATQDPLDPEKPFIRLMKTHDTGSAIRGTIRGDIYFGSGDLAAQKAGAMNHPGEMWVLLEE